MYNLLPLKYFFQYVGMKHNPIPFIPNRVSLYFEKIYRRKIVTAYRMRGASMPHGRGWDTDALHILWRF